MKLTVYSRDGRATSGDDHRVQLKLGDLWNTRCQPAHPLKQHGEGSEVERPRLTRSHGDRGGF
ncbi:MAG TPA: hypothetical protein VLX90_09755 [Steroidobacteraceae bacterium]|nr:hypothetical protein [Steroidobacteraceae bacterium]